MCRPTPASRAVAVSPAMAGGSGTSWPCTTSPANRAISPSSRLAATAPGTAPAPPPGRGPASAQASATTLQQASACSATYVPQPTALTVITTARSIAGSPSSRPAATAATCWTFNADPVPAGPPWLSGRCGAAHGRTSRAVLRRPSRPTATVASSHGSSRPGRAPAASPAHTATSPASAHTPASQPSNASVLSWRPIRRARQPPPRAAPPASAVIGVPALNHTAAHRLQARAMPDSELRARARRVAQPAMRRGSTTTAVVTVMSSPGTCCVSQCDVIRDPWPPTGQL